MTLSHLPGPWRAVCTNGRYWHVEGPDGHIVVNVSASRVTADGTDTAANARLIAAAPELLDVAKEMTAYLEALALPAPNAGDLMIAEAQRLIQRIEGKDGQ